MDDGDLKSDVMTYCGDALHMFGDIPRENCSASLEIAMLVANGLPVTNPSIKHKLLNVAEDYSSLNPQHLEYVGFKIIDPTVDMGFNIAA